MADANRLSKLSINATHSCLLALIGSGEAPKLPAYFPGMQSMILRRLLPVDIEALSVAMLGTGGQRPHLVTFLQQETEGNTFFIVETLRVLAEEAGQLDRVAVMTLPKQIFPWRYAASRATAFTTCAGDLSTALTTGGGGWASPYTAPHTGTGTND